MDVRIALRVRERRDADLILGQGAHAAGWQPETLTQPGKFLISAPEHTIPRPARGYLLTNADITAVAHRNTTHRPPGAGHHPTPPTTIPRPRASSENDRRTETRPTTNTSQRAKDADGPLWAALSRSGHEGASATELVQATGLSMSTVYRRLRALARAGHAEQTGTGRWRLTTTQPTPAAAPEADADTPT